MKKKRISLVLAASVLTCSMVACNMHDDTTGKPISGYETKESVTTDHYIGETTADEPYDGTYEVQGIGDSYDYGYEHITFGTTAEVKQNYDYLNKMGFNNFYGHTDWFCVKGYNFNNGYAYGHGGWDYSFNEGVFLEGEINKNGNTYKFEKSTNQGSVSTYTATNNNSINFNNGRSTNTWVIYERVVDEYNGYIVLKTRNGYNERWYVPADLIDWSCSPSEVNIDGETKVCFYFK